MEILNDLLQGIKTGEYWFISVAILFYMVSVLMMLITEKRSFENSEEQGKAVNFAARMVLASIAVLISSILFVVMSGTKLKFVLIVGGVVMILLMINVEKLPIWQEEDNND